MMAHLECDVITPVDIVLSVAVAGGPDIASESLKVFEGRMMAAVFTGSGR